jgi:hypothetical protein
LSDQEKAALEAHGLHNLNDFLPKKPTDVEVKVIQEMFEASVDGEAYDPERFGQYFRAPGMSAPTGDPNKSASAPAASTAAPAPTPASEPVAETVAQPAPAATTASANQDKPSSERANDILAMIRSRQS